MTPRDFCYWLQGTFELGKVQSMDASQLDILRKHLQLVYRAQYDDSRNPDAWVGKEFCDWLTGVLSVASNDGLSEAQTKTIATRLNKTFQHVIDGTFENLDELLDIHHGRERPEDDEEEGRIVAMC